ncbi:helix-turn-helix transcriptional regulator [Viridibacillus sp. NPDC096237]|uniref:helix-turn-helix transcriptional regulator n=1 Tax=Viridibacillus sp. NPDC096237 TaxID=3390721 RepID=UPI003CFDFA54
MKVHNRIKEVRKQKGIPQLQITCQTITAIENHKYNPSLELALKLLQYFDLPIEELFTLEASEKRKS